MQTKPDMPRCPWCGSGMTVNLAEFMPYKFSFTCLNYHECRFAGPLKDSREAAIAAVRRVRLTKEGGD